MPEAESNSLLVRLEAGRREFLELVEQVRPDLHRYCARMVGSTIDGEDIVQDTLARAYYELGELKELPALKSWLFRIAHNRALDWLRRYERRMSDPLDAARELPVEDELPPDAALARRDAVEAALACFLELAPSQRACVILKEVLDHSLEEIAALLDLTVPAVKAALHRGRGRLRTVVEASRARNAPPAPSPELVRYATLFNARDWDAVRALLAEDVRLDLVSEWKTAGRGTVQTYFTNYDRLRGWRVAVGRLEGREVLAFFPSPDSARPAYAMALEFRDGRVAGIRDYRYVPYLLREATVTLAALET